MIISHSHKYIFIKSAKTAGTSIEAALSNSCSGNDIVTPLNDFAFNRDKEGQWIHHAMNFGVFHQHEWASNIKNKVGTEIWDSYFKFSIARNPWDRVVSLFSWNSRNNPIDDFREAKKLFSSFVKGDWKTNDRFYLIDGQLCADFVIRYEELLDGYRKVCKKIGVAEIPLSHLKTGFRKGYHYSEYYDDECKAIVAERHKNDIKLFGYQFETV